MQESSVLRAHLSDPVEGYRTIRLLSAYRHAQEDLRNGAGEGSTAARQLTIACEKTGCDAARADELIVRWMEVEPLDLLRAHRRDGLIDTLVALRDSGLRLALLSDYPAQAKLAALESDHLFEVVVSAQDPEVGVFKPSPRGIEVTLSRLGVLPNEAVYIGDRHDVDYPAANAAGVECAIFTSSAPTDPPYTALHSCRHLQDLLLAG